MKQLHERSDGWGFLQAGGVLATYVATGGLAFYAVGRWPWWAVVLLVFLHGTCVCFHPSAVHELSHGTVFKTRWLNSLFERIFGFIGWNNFLMFDVSHVRHHQFTLHPPDDLEVVLPAQLFKVKHFLEGGITHPFIFKYRILSTWRLARGQFEGEWFNALFPAAHPEKRRGPVHWARIILIGHGLLAVGAIVAGFYDHRFWILPVLVNFPSFYGSWLHNLCAFTQHTGLQDNVPDFRLCCRSITLNPIVKFLYWHMNYHTEHHMYAAVPCYRLHQLYAAVKHDVPAPRRGLLGAWREIAAIQKIQATNPQYQHVVAVPNPRPKDR